MKSVVVNYLYFVVVRCVIQCLWQRTKNIISACLVIFITCFSCSCVLKITISEECYISSDVVLVYNQKCISH